MGSVYERAEPYLLSVFVCVCYAGYNIISKVSLSKGMSPFVLVFYAQAFATVITALLSLIFERSNRPKINLQILLNIFFLGLFAMSTRTLHYKGLQRTTSTFTSSISILFPAITFMLALLFRIERLEIKKSGGQAKVVGTVMALAGATLMTLYRGIIVIPALSSGHLSRTHAKESSSIDKDWITGSLMVLGSAFSRASFSILQTMTIKKYSAPLSLTFLVCFVGTLQTAVMALAMDHKVSAWRLGWDLRLFSALYCGVLVFGVTIYVTFLVIRKRGPVFSTAFTPLTTIIVAVVDVLILQQSLHMGSAIGAVLIVVGLYIVLWGKSKEIEMKPSKEELPCQINPSDSNQNQKQSAEEAIK